MLAEGREGRGGAGTTRSAKLGGLYVLGTERHESRRIDNQLRGRSGRQGDPGESRFYLSLTGRPHAAVQLRAPRSGPARPRTVPDDVPLEVEDGLRRIQRAQNQIESRNAEMRKNVLKYDDVLTDSARLSTRSVARILEGEDLDEQVQKFIDEVIGGTVDAHTTAGPPEDCGTSTSCSTPCGPLYARPFTAEELIEEASGTGEPQA